MRDLSTGFITQIDARALRPLLLTKAEFDSGPVLMFSGTGEMEFDGETYSGGGNLLRVSTVEETQELKAVNVTYELSGVPSNTVSLALQENYQGRTITTWFGVLDDNDALDTYPIYGGYMDTMQIADDGDESTIAMNTESGMVILRNAVDRNYTPEDQKVYYPGDKGLDFVPLIQDMEIQWGPPS